MDTKCLIKRVDLYIFFSYFFSFLEIFSSNIETNITNNYIDTIESQEFKLYLEKIYSIIENFIKKKEYLWIQRKTNINERKKFYCKITSLIQLNFKRMKRTVNSN